MKATYYGHLVIYATVAMLVWSNTVAAQSLTESQKSLRLDVGLSFISIKDLSASPLLYTGTGPRVGVAYTWGRQSTVDNELMVSYRGGVIANTTPAESGFTVHHGSIRYRRLWAVGAGENLRVGGTSALFARIRVHDFYDNNFLSYDIGWNVGIATAYTQTLTDRLFATFYANLPLVAYYVRPVYGFNFPKSFLTEENYNQRLDGLYPTLLTSGEVVSFNKYFELNTRVSLTYQWSGILDQIQLSYQWNYAQFKSLESSYFGEQILLISLVRNL